MKYEIRGIVKILKKGKEEIEIVIRDENGENYSSIKYPQGKPLNREQVILFVAEKMKIQPENFTIPSHLIKFFETEESKEKGEKQNG